jgi:tetratricopeptide (TPR) repeat protein
MIKKASIGWILIGIAALVLCTPLGAIPALFYGVYFYPTQFARNTEGGKPLVQAVYAYRSVTGLYPAMLDDLVPDYIAVIPNDWQYTPPSGGRPPRLQLHGAFHSYLNYYFARPSNSKLSPSVWPEGWEYNQEGTLHFQGSDKFPATPFQKANGELIALRLHELRRRVDVAKSESDLLHAYTRLISELVRVGQLDEAGNTCRQCLSRLEARWCLMALAELDLRCGQTAGLDGFVAWTRQSPSFPRYFVIAQLYRQHGKVPEALAALSEGLEHTLDGTNDDETYGPESDCYQSALFAYRSGRHDLALAICDKWEQYVQARGYGEESYHALRAASFLATGRQPEAKLEIARAVLMYREHRTWADNLPALDSAIQSGDRSFVYDPNERGPDNPIFLDEIQ